MNNLYGWLSLILAGITEIMWAYFMKESNGFTLLLPTVLYIIFALISMGLLTYATKILPISIAYLIWVGIGSAGTIIIGYIFFNETVSSFKVFFIFLIISGVMGLKFYSSESSN